MDKVTPVNEIYSLDPTLHPRAWFEVMANALTSIDEKNEAMEEILILAKDRKHARLLLEEGILDSMMYIIRDFFQAHVSTNLSDTSLHHAKLAANCCIAFGKAHCAGFHVEGEWTFGSVSISMQVAQMLFQVPHHEVMKTKLDANETSEIFKLTSDMTMEQAENLSKVITSLAEGNIVNDYEIML